MQPSWLATRSPPHSPCTRRLWVDVKLALAGDTMLGRNVAERLAVVAPTALFADDVVAAAHEADLFVLNLECAISDRGEPWPDEHKQFFFRAPPVAVEALQHLG